MSAHWYVPYTAVTAMQTPRTIHDFGGFPRELFEFQYPAPGSPEIATEVRNLARARQCSSTMRGAWITAHGACCATATPMPMFLSCNSASTKHCRHRLTIEIGGSLAALRERGILIVGSGNLVHNLHAYGWGRRVVEPYDWAVRFEQPGASMDARGRASTADRL